MPVGRRSLVCTRSFTADMFPPMLRGLGVLPDAAVTLSMMGGQQVNVDPQTSHAVSAQTWG